ncbi:uncharacterized protein LOC128395368 [Panonychus citri]|uniref:uncharacterized protein LOC128395368 n=1 Tax=Panonychus citri TaxID=50023 RepID=UPI0023081565|nr:uncharacterized protein LOC128395368 [Panonychus citri]
MIKVSWVLIVFLITLTIGTSSSIKEADFLRSVVKKYSPSLVVSFLKTRINYNKEMIGKIKNLTVNLDQSRRDLFDLNEKFYSVMVNQLITLKDADYFDTDGSNKVNYFIEQFVLQDELYPIGFGSFGMVKVPMTPDELISQLNVKPAIHLINETNILIKSYINDTESKELIVGNNIIQQLSLTMTKAKLKSLLEFNYVSGSENHQIGNNLKKLKTISDFFYSQYDQLSNEKMST